MRIIFFGSPAEAAAALDSLIEAGHEVAAAYTQPDRKSGRGRKTTPTPVSVSAQHHGVPAFTPRSLRNNEEEVNRLRTFDADVFVVVAYGRILPPEVLGIPPMGVVNVHPSLLPRYRGPSPVVTAILDGAKSTGVSIMLLDEGMDTGPVLAHSDEMPLTGLERGAELQSRLFKEGATMLPSVLAGLADGSVTPTPQDDTQASTTGLLERADGEIDWANSATQIDRMVRAYDPWPGAYTSWNGKTLKILEARARTDNAAASGKIALVDGKLFVGCGNSTLELIKLQIEGRQAASAIDFLNGYPSFNGATLGE